MRRQRQDPEDKKRNGPKFLPGFRNVLCTPTPMSGDVRIQPTPEPTPRLREHRVAASAAVCRRKQNDREQNAPFVFTHGFAPF
jgi:hypothetical protein